MSYDNLDKLTDYIRKLQTVDDSDVFMGVTGRKGTGKTSWSMQVSRNYVKKYFDEEYFSVKKYMCYDNNEVFDKVHTLPMYAPIAGDEAIRFAWSREWNKSENKDLIKLATQIRPKKHILFMNIPRMVWIDKAYREGMLTIWAWIHSTIEDGQKKSYAILFEPDENQGEVDSWHLKELRQTEGKIRKIGRFTDIDTMYKFVKNHPCFMDIIQFPKVPVDIYEEYMRLRTEKVMKKDEQYIDQRELGKIMSYNIMKNWDVFKGMLNEGRFDRPTFRMIADALCYNPATKTSIVQHTTIRNWVQEIQDTIPSQQKLEVEQLIESEQEDANEFA